jgi:2-keto-4-pentenoate hydratase/2-oxohepta-3-ene-1,7-dioic acid hydratase in catechol pathway
MRIAAFSFEGQNGAGRLSADGTGVEPFVLTPQEGELGGLAVVRRMTGGQGLEKAPEPIPLSALELRAPIPVPARNIFCVGKNYRAHVAEIARAGFDTTGAGDALPQLPVVFSKLPQTVAAPGVPIRVDPQVSEAVDYEAELAVIIGTGGRCISAARAMEHVFGYTIVNDVTARDIQRRHKQWLLGKSQDGFCPMGPWIVSADELDPTGLDVCCRVNGEIRQQANTQELIFDIPTLIETISTGITLVSGDVIATGTPAGVGAGFDPPRYLRDGDVVTIDIAGIGVLENPVVTGPSSS